MERKDYRLAAILYTDIAGFSKMMEKNEERTLELLGIHNELICSVVHAHQGTVIKTIGDAFLLDFKNTVDALQSAIEIQYKLLAYNKKNPELPLLVRIGLHLGDIYFYENDALGEGINIASRLQSIAHPGCICMSQDVYNMVLNKVDFAAEKLGRVSLKNITKEIHAYEIATPNVEFDPNRSAKPILVPEQQANSSNIKQNEEKFNSVSEKATDTDNSQTGREAVKEKATKEESKKDQDEQTAFNAKKLDIKRRVFLDIKAAGRQLSADQMMIRYGNEGAAAATVIEELSSKGILLRQTPTEAIDDSYKPQAASKRTGIVHAVTDLEYRIEDEVKRSLSEAFRSRRMAKNPSERRAARAASIKAAHKFRTEIHTEIHKSNKWEKDPNESPKAELKWDGKLAKSYFRSEADGLSEYDGFAAKVRNEARNAKAGFIGHCATFLAVNAFLMVINSITSPHFPWALFSFGGWGIGVLEHFASVLRRGEKAKDLSKLPALNAEQLSLFKKIQKRRDSLFLHFTSTISTSAFLIMINLLTPSQFPWSLFPVGGMLIGLISHAAAYFANKRNNESKFLESLGASGSWKRALTRMPKPKSDYYGDLGPYRELLDSAITTRAAILSQVSTGNKKKGKRDKAVNEPLDAEFIPTLDSYVDQIALIAQKTLEVDNIIEMIPMDALRYDKADLEAKIEANPSESLKREYQKSLQEIERQETSFRELKDQREVLELRMRSSVNTLKQMRIDLARLSSIPEGNDTIAAQTVRDKTSELHKYLEDLRAGYAELENLEDKRFIFDDDKA